MYEGVCDMALVNSYYFGKVKNSEIPEQRDWVSDVGIRFTNQADRGNHINISGAEWHVTPRTKRPRSGSSSS